MNSRDYQDGIESSQVFSTGYDSQPLRLTKDFGTKVLFEKLAGIASRIWRHDYCWCCSIESDFLRRCFVRTFNAGFLCILLATSIQIQAQENVGYVLDIKGDWYLNKPRPRQQLKRWQKLSGGSRIVTGKSKESRSIKIALLNSETIEHTCSVDVQCPPIILPTTNEKPKLSSSASIQREPTVTERIKDAFRSLFGHPETYYVPTYARNGTPQDFQEAVVAWNSGRTDLSPVFKNMAAGSYRLVADSPPRGSQKVALPNSIYININWNPEEPSSAATDKLKPGLYSLPGGSEHEAWILVAAPEDYRAAKGSFQQAVAETERWGKAVDTQTSRMFLRAYLESLAKRMKKPASRKRT